MRILLITPPMVQLNAPYAAGPFLAGALRGRGWGVKQVDASLELFLKLFSYTGFREIERELKRRFRGKKAPAAVRFFLSSSRRYVAGVDPAIRFLQGRAPGLARRIASRRFLPEGPRFRVISDAASALGFRDEDGALAHLFGPEGLEGRAKFIASLFVDDVADVIRQGIDPNFELSRYAERLAVRAPSYTPIHRALGRPPSLVDRHMDKLAQSLVRRYKPDLVGFTVPFPGNLYGALRLARQMRRHRPGLKVALGGGYISTELRDLSDVRLFEDVDYVVLDEGETPLLRIGEHIAGRRPEAKLCRAFVRAGKKVVFKDDARPPVQKVGDEATPDYAGLDFARYVSLAEMPNPMHRLWSDGRWNRLALAHGCYWHRCAFCDTRLNYISGYRASDADALVDRMEAVAKQTGSREFHFVDEAAPPALLRRLSERLIARRASFTWWTNIRLEKAFDRSLCALMARAGCVAVTGGLEGVTDRLLTRMNKGVRLHDAVRALAAFSGSGILTHAYLMYDFPGQTARDAVDALEIVRQLFEEGYLHSAYWHRFALTVHSPMYEHPDRFGIRLVRIPFAGFARNEAGYEERAGKGCDSLAPGLKKALYNYMYGVGLDRPVTEWFDRRVPSPRVPPDFVRHLLVRPS